MASRRKSKGIKVGAIALAAAGGGAVYAVARRRGASAPAEDRIDAGGAGAVATPPAPAAVVEESARGHSVDAAEQPIPVQAQDSRPAPELAEPPHGPPPGAVMPDTSAGDPLVENQAAAAAAQAGSIGGKVESEDEPVAVDDPAMRPVLEGSGDDEETFEQRSGAGGPDREKPL